MRPYNEDNSISNPLNSHFVEFDLVTSFGNSGSPVFDHYGFVIAILNSAIGTYFYDDIFDQIFYQGDIGNFGIRIDEVWDLIEYLNSVSKPALNGRILAQKPVPVDYKPFPPGMELAGTY